MSNQRVDGCGLDDRMIDQKQHRAIDLRSKLADPRLNGRCHSLLVVRIDDGTRYLNGRQDCVRMMPDDHDCFAYGGAFYGFEDVLEKGAASKG